MEFSTKRGSPEKRATPCIAVGVYAGHKLSASAESLDRASLGSLREVLRRGDMEGKLGATLLLYRVPGVAAERVLLVGLGAEADLREREYREAARAAIKAAQGTGAGTATHWPRQRQRRGSSLAVEQGAADGVLVCELWRGGALPECVARDRSECPPLRETEPSLDEIEADLLPRRRAHASPLRASKHTRPRARREFGIRSARSVKGHNEVAVQWLD